MWRKRVLLAAPEQVLENHVNIGGPLRRGSCRLRLFKELLCSFLVATTELDQGLEIEQFLEPLSGRLPLHQYLNLGKGVEVVYLFTGSNASLNLGQCRLDLGGLQNTLVLHLQTSRPVGGKLDNLLDRVAVGGDDQFAVDQADRLVKQLGSLDTLGLIRLGEELVTLRQDRALLGEV